MFVPQPEPHWIQNHFTSLLGSNADMAWVLHEKLYGQYWMKKWEKLPTPTKKRVLILMCCTGGGHKASATALSEALTASIVSL
jgi:hypothetical protein